MLKAATSRSGVMLAIMAATLFGASTPLSKLLLHEMSPWLLAGVLYLGSGICLLAMMLLLRHRIFLLPRSDLPWLLGAILSGGVVAPALLMTGLSLTDAASASLLLNAEVVLTALLAWTFFRENADRRVVLGLLAIMAGALTLSWPTQTIHLSGWGPLAVLGACLGWAIDNNLTRKLALNSPLLLATVKGLVAGGTNTLLALTVGHAPLPPLSTLAPAALVGFLGYGVSLMAFVLALRHLGAARTGAYFASAPFVGAFLAVLLLDDPITPPLLVATALMALGLWLHLTEIHDHPHDHPTVTHTHAHTHDAHHIHDHPDLLPPPHRHTHTHAHTHAHAPLRHQHAHTPDAHHRHDH